MYRGSTVEFNSCLNLTRQQFVVSTNPDAPPQGPISRPPQPRIGAFPAIQPSNGQLPAAGFHPSARYAQYK